MANPALPPDTFLTAFGLYVLTPEIFPILKRQIQNNARECGSFQLTSALDELRKDQGLVGICVAGERYNIGTPQSFLRSLQDLQLAQ
uniref:Utp--glucose-1-phosphate uridylyltransferase n=2 Tax=Tetraselmis sp. GSL018 TaxID=582737 RepID=A0A061RW79_9CHLO